MPRNLKRGPKQVNPAVAALGVGVKPGKWEASSMIEAMERRYLQLYQMGDEQTTVGRPVRARMHYAAAHELATIVAEYHREKSSPEEFTKWEHRKRRSQFLAYATRNQIADTLGAGTDGQIPSEEN